MKRFVMLGFLCSTFMVLFFSCQKELSQESNLNNASFSFHDDSTKACYLVTVNGSYYNGVSAVRDTNFITVVVNVKSTGNYAISTDSLYGFYFTDSGFFSKTGLDTLILKAKGTPILIQETPFTFPSDSLGSCGFSVDVQDSTGTGLGGIVDTTGGTTGGGTTSGSYSASYTDPNPAADGTWHFADSTNGNKNYGGNIQLGGQLADDGDGTSTFQCEGFDANNSNLAFIFSLQFPTASITTGSYKVDGIATRIFLTDITTAVNNYDANAGTAKEDADPSYINITSYDATSKRIKGSFRCWAQDANGNPALIKGSFNTTVIF